MDQSSSQVPKTSTKTTSTTYCIVLGAAIKSLFSISLSTCETQLIFRLHLNRSKRGNSWSIIGQHKKLCPYFQPVANPSILPVYQPKLPAHKVCVHANLDSALTNRQETVCPCDFQICMFQALATSLRFPRAIPSCELICLIACQFITNKQALQKEIRIAKSLKEKDSVLEKAP